MHNEPRSSWTPLGDVDPSSKVYVGLMSGTSLDGISAAAVRFERVEGRVAHTVLGFRVLDYTAADRDRVKAAINGATPEEYCRLAVDIGEWLSQAALSVMAECGVPRSDVVVASHGQTLWHVPGHSTWQVGEPAVIAERTGCPVISDFRVRDVAAGGQGAPLVPIADALLFSSATHWRALQNIGGIGNFTVVPPHGELQAVRALDTGPGVVVIDAVTRVIDPGLRFDADGRIARQGRAIDGAVAEALSHPYFAAEPPKSTGRELFTPAYVEAFIASCRHHSPNCTAADLVATAVEFTAASIADAFARFVAEPVSEVLVSGGGAKNPALMDALRRRLAPLDVRRFDDEFYDGEAKEAVAFALMGYLFASGQAANVPGATGARGPRLLGKLTPA